MMITLIAPNAPLAHLSTTRNFFTAQNSPLGLQSLAAYLLKNGIQVEQLFDLTLHQYTRAEFVEAIQQSHSTVFGISVTTETANNALRLSALIKSIRPSATVVLGGPHITFMALDILSHSRDIVDFCVEGEGELTLLELLQTLRREEKRYAQIDGLVWACPSGEIRRNPRRSLIANLDDLPFPSRELCPTDRYEEMAIQTTRGCPGVCPFCAAASLFDGKLRARSAENVVAEIETISQKYRPKSFMFSDDTFTVNPKRLTKMADLILEKNLISNFYCEARMDTLNSSVINKLQQIGCTRLQVGIESAVESTRKIFKKGATNQQIFEVARCLEGVGIKPITNFILGLPHETLDQMQLTLDFANELVDNFNFIVNFSLCTPLPGTAYYQNPARYGIRFIERNFDYYNFEIPVFETENFTAFDLNALYLQAMTTTQRGLQKYWRQLA